MSKPVITVLMAAGYCHGNRMAINARLTREKARPGQHGVSDVNVDKLPEVNEVCLRGLWDGEGLVSIFLRSL